MTIQSGELDTGATSTYTGGTTINAGATLQLGNGGTTGSVAGDIVDNGLLKFNYSGAVTTAGSISGTGSVETVAGTTVLTGTGAVGGTVTIDSGSTLQWGNGVSGAFLVGGGNAVVDNGSLVMNFGSSGIVGALPISGTGSVTLQSGLLIDTAASTYTGGTTINAGATLQLGDGTGTGGTLAGGIVDNGLLKFNYAGTQTAANTISGSGSVETVAGTTVVTGFSFVGGTVTINSGSTLQWGDGVTTGFLVGSGLGVVDNGSLVMNLGGILIGDIPISGTGSVTIQSGELDTGATSTYTGGTTINAGATLQLGNGGTTGSVAGDIVDNGLLKFNYSGAVTTAGSISGTGSVETVAGTTVVTGTSFVGGTVTIDSGSTMQWGNGGPAFLVGGGNAVVDNGSLVMNFGGGGIAGAIPISGTGSVTIQSGSFNESGVSTYTGATTIDSAGFLLLTAGGSIATSSGVLNNGIFDISGTTAGASITSIAGSGTVGLGAQTLTLTAASGTFSGAMADGGLFGGTGGGLTIAAGTETLTGTNTYTGATTINLGATLQLGNGGTTGSVAGDIVDNGLLKFNYSGAVTTAGSISGTGSVETVAGTTVVTGTSFVGGTVTIDSGSTLQWGNGGPAFLVGAGNAVVDNGSLVMNFGGGGIAGAIPISGTGSVTIQSGSFNESGVSTYTGATTIDSAGFLLLTAGGSIATSSGVLNNGIFDISGTTAGASITSIAGSGTVGLGAQTLTLTAASGTFSGVMADGGLFGGTGGGLTIAAGTETLTGTNTYTGLTTINGGATLQLGDGSGTGGTVAGDILDNGLLKFNYAGTQTAANAISGSGSVQVRRRHSVHDGHQQLHRSDHHQRRRAGGGRFDRIVVFDHGQQRRRAGRHRNGGQYHRRGGRHVHAGFRDSRLVDDGDRQSQFCVGRHLCSHYRSGRSVIRQCVGHRDACRDRQCDLGARQLYLQAVHDPRCRQREWNVRGHSRQYQSAVRL